MKKKLIILAGAALAVVLLGAAVAVPAFADEPTPTPEVPFGGHGRGFGLWGGSWTMFDAAAEALGLTPEEFFAELHAGQSLAEIAEEQGVEIEAVQDAINAVQGERDPGLVPFVSCERNRAWSTTPGHQIVTMRRDQ